MNRNFDDRTRDRRIALVVLVLACALGALLTARGGSRSCSPLVGMDGSVTYVCEPPVGG